MNYQKYQSSSSKLSMSICFPFSRNLLSRSVGRSGVSLILWRSAILYLRLWSPVAPRLLFLTVLIYSKSAIREGEDELLGELRWARSRHYWQRFQVLLFRSFAKLEQMFISVFSLSKCCLLSFTSELVSLRMVERLLRHWVRAFRKSSQNQSNVLRVFLLSQKSCFLVQSTLLKDSCKFLFRIVTQLALLYSLFLMFSASSSSVLLLTERRLLSQGKLEMLTTDMPTLGFFDEFSSQSISLNSTLVRDLAYSVRLVFQLWSMDLTLMDWELIALGRCLFWERQCSYPGAYPAWEGRCFAVEQLLRCREKGPPCFYARRQAVLAWWKISGRELAIIVIMLVIKLKRQSYKVWIKIFLWWVVHIQLSYLDGLV